MNSPAFSSPMSLTDMGDEEGGKGDCTMLLALIHLEHMMASDQKEGNSRVSTVFLFPHASLF